MDVAISSHGDHDGDGFGDWEEYAAGSEGNNSASIPPSAPTNAAPAFAGSSATFNVAENNASALFQVTATDADGDPLTYSLTGPDAAKFDLNATSGILRFLTVPDFEAGTGALGNNTYLLNVTVSDSTVSALLNVMISVTDVYEPPPPAPNQPPSFSGGSTFSTPENNSSASFEITATDPDANTTLVYSSSGPDAGKFTLNVATGTLTFTNTPDYEANASVAGNNAFSLTITVTDGEANATQSVTVNVTNMVEDFDFDGIEDHFDTDDDGDGFSDTAEIAYGSDPRNANSVANQAPTALDLNNTTIAENQHAGTIVGKLTGVDPDGNATLAFSRANGQGSKHNNQFFVGPNNNLKTKAPIDFEANATLKVRLKVTDEHNASIEQTFVITVLDDPTDNNTSVVDANGTFVDTNATLPDNNATVPDSNGTYVDTNATVPDGNGTFVDTNATSPDDNGTLPDSNATAPNPNVTLPDDNATIPDQNGTVAESNEPHPDQNGTFVDTNATLPDDNATVTDSSVTVPDPNPTPPDQNETMVEPHEPHADGNGTVPDQNGTLADHNQTHVDTNGTIPDANTTIPDANATIPDANVTVPDPNPTLPDQNETMVEPHEPHTDGNGTVQDQNGTLVDHNQTHVDTNGTIPDANTTIPDDNATIPGTNETIAPPAAPTYRPIARTLRAETDAEGRLKLNGVVLTDGGATVTEVGFILSRSLFAGLDSPGAIVVGGTLSGDAFYASTIMPDLGKRFYYRAYATNAKGTNFGSPKRFVVSEPRCACRMVGKRGGSGSGLASFIVVRSVSSVRKRLDISCRPRLALRPTGRRRRALGLERRQRLALDQPGKLSLPVPSRHPPVALLPKAERRSAPLLQPRHQRGGVNPCRPAPARRGERVSRTTK